MADENAAAPAATETAAAPAVVETAAVDAAAVAAVDAAAAAHAPVVEAAGVKTREEKLLEAKAALANLGIDVKDLVVPEPAPPAPPKGPCAALRAWNVAQCAAVTSVLKTWSFTKCVGNIIKGIRTLFFFTVAGAIGLADSLNGIDLSGILEQYLGTKVKVGDLITLMSIAGIMLRLVTRTPAFTRWQHDKFSEGDGLAAGTGTGAVDEVEHL